MKNSQSIPKKNLWSTGSNFILDPRTKMIVLLSSIICVLYSINLYLLVSFFYIAFLLMIISKPKLKITLLSFFFLTLFSAITTVIIHFTVGLQNPYTLFIITECRFVTVFFLFIWFLRTVEPYELAVVFEKMYIPAKLTWFLIMIYQFIPTVMQEAQEINEIRRLKGLTAKKWQLKKQLYNMKKSLKPLITGAINRGIDSAESMILKGFEPVRRKLYIYNISVKIRDIIIMCFSIACLVLVIIYL